MDDNEPVERLGERPASTDDCSENDGCTTILEELLPVALSSNRNGKNNQHMYPEIFKRGHELNLATSCGSIFPESISLQTAVLPKHPHGVSERFRS